MCLGQSTSCVCLRCDQHLCLRHPTSSPSVYNVTSYCLLACKPDFLLNVHSVANQLAGVSCMRQSLLEFVGNAAASLYLDPTLDT